MYDALVLIIAGGGAGFLASLGYKWSLERRVYGLECDVSDLQNKILIEIKRRAALTPRLSKDEQLILEKLDAKPTEPAKPWWEPYAALKDRGS